MNNLVSKYEGLNNFCIGSYFLALIASGVATLFVSWPLLIDFGLYLLFLRWAYEAKDYKLFYVGYVVFWILHIFAGGIYMVLDPLALIGIATMVTQDKIPNFLKWVVK